MPRQYSGSGAGFTNPSGYDAGIGSLDELGSWFAYGFPGGVTGSAGDADDWTDLSGNSRDLNIASAPNPAQVDTTTLPSNKSILDCTLRGAGADECLIRNTAADDAEIRNWHVGTFFAAFIPDAASGPHQLIGITSQFSSRFISFQYFDASAGDVGFRFVVDRPGNITGQSTYTSDFQEFPLGSLATIWGCCHGRSDDGSPPAETITMYHNIGAGVVKTASVSKVIHSTAVDGMWFDTMDQIMNGMSAGAKGTVTGTENTGITGQVAAWGIMGGTTAELEAGLTEEQIIQGDAFVRAQL